MIKIINEVVVLIVLENEKSFVDQLLHEDICDLINFVRIDVASPIRVDLVENLMFLSVIVD